MVLTSDFSCSQVETPDFELGCFALALMGRVQMNKKAAVNTITFIVFIVLYLSVIRSKAVAK